MKNYIFKIGKKKLELLAPSVDSAYSAANSFALSFGWKGKVTLI